tara:strand:- start:13646 stop:15706 length:2061 start_codon:yes stop_codon:yes gene_type:complete
MAVPAEFKNYRTGFLAQGDPVGMTGGDFNLNGALTQTNPMHIDVRGLSLARLHGILSKRSQVLSGNGTAVTDGGGPISIITVTSNTPHGLKLGQMVSLSGTTGFATADEDTKSNGTYPIIALTEDTFNYVASDQVTGGPATAINWSAVVAAKDATQALVDAKRVVTVNVEDGHGLTSGQQIIIVDASGWDVNAYATSNLVDGTDDDYTRSVEVTVVSSTVFSYEVHAARDPGATGKISYQCDPLYTQFKLFDGIQDNQRISLINSNDSSFSLDVSNIEILDKWIPQQNDTLELYWSALKKKWVGLADQLREDTDMRQNTVILQSAEIQIMMPDAQDYITLIDAPGPGKYIKVHEARLAKKAVGAQFVERNIPGCTIVNRPAAEPLAVAAAVGTTITVTDNTHTITDGTKLLVSAAAGFTVSANANGTWVATNVVAGVSFDFVVDVAPNGGPGTLTYQSLRGDLRMPEDYLTPRLSVNDRVVLTGIGTGITDPGSLTSPGGTLGADIAIKAKTGALSFDVAVNGAIMSGVAENDSVQLTVINKTTPGTFYYMFHDQGDGASHESLNIMLPNNQVRDGFLQSVSDTKSILVPQTDFLQGENLEVQDFTFSGGGDGARRTGALAATSVDLENKPYVMNLLTAATGLPAGVNSFKPQGGAGLDNEAAVPEWTVTLRYEIIDISAIGELKS